MLVGRRVEMEALSDTIARARSGGGGALLLRGEPGIGKTALLRWARAQHGVTALDTSGHEVDASLPFAALGSLLRPVVDHRGALPPAQRAALEAALALGPPFQGDRFAAYGGALMLLEAASDALGPLLLTVDDAHWLDAPSMEALAYCARRLDDLPVALLVATRVGEGNEPSLPTARAVTLEPLARHDAHMLLSTAGGDGLPRATADAVLRAAAGNPLALVEIPGTLSDAERAGREPLPDPLRLTDAIQQAFNRRIEGLSDAARRALVVVAAGIGEPADAIRGACEQLGCGADALGEAAAARVVEAGADVITFVHPLLRAVVLDRATPAEVREAHRLLAVSAPPDRAGWHLAAAAIGQDEAAAAAMDTVGGIAAARTAYASASRAFAVAAELTAEPDARAGRLMQAAGLAQLSGRFPEAAMRLEEAAAQARNPVLAAEVDHLRGLVHTYAGSTADGVRLLFDSAGVVAAHSPTRSAQMLVDSSMAWGMAGQPAMCIVACDMARGLAALDDIGLARLELAAGNSRFFVGRGRETRARAAEISRACDLLAPVGPNDHALVCGTIVRMYIGDFDGATAVIERCVAACREAGAPGPLAFFLATSADLAFRTDRWTEGMAAAEEAIEVGTETGQIPIAGYAMCVQARFRGVTGDREAARALLTESEPLRMVANTDALTAWALHAEGLFELSGEAFDAAAAALERLVHFWENLGVRCAESVPWEHDLIEAYLALGRTTDARRRLRILAEEAQGSDGPQVHALVARCRGLMDGDHERHFQEALAHHSRVTIPFELARTHLCFGERLRRDRRRGRAEQQLRRALEIFEALGAAPWAARARRELEATGAVPGAPVSPAFAQLTAREVQVALAVGRGATNREAAARLFLSEKTVARHLSAVYAKLGLRSRTELIALVAREAPGSG